MKLWDVATGKDLFTFKSQEPCRAVSLSVGDRMAAYTTDQFMGQPSAIHLVNIADDLSEQSGDVIKSVSGPKGRITRVAWTDLNRTLVSAGEDGFVRRWDVEVYTITDSVSSAPDCIATVCIMYGQFAARLPPSYHRHAC